MELLQQKTCHIYEPEEIDVNALLFCENINLLGSMLLSNAKLFALQDDRCEVNDAGQNNDSRTCGEVGLVA